MQKVIDFLEKYVQWIAIALGGVYLLWMVYAYVLNTKAVDVTVGNTELSPGKVDSYVLNTFAEPLKAKIDSAKPVTITVPNFGDIVNLNMPAEPAVASNWVNSTVKGVQIPDLTQPQPNNPNPGNPNNPNPPAVAGSGKVQQLPKPPVAVELATATGRSSVIIPPQQINASYQTAVQAILAPPNPNGQPQQPPQIQAQQINTGTLDANGKPLPGTDIDWVTVSYKIKVPDLANEFARCNIPVGQQQQLNTCFLDVELVRQEQLPNGQWGNDTVIPKLSTSDQPPMPEAKAPRALMQAYLGWALSSMSTLLHPVFYPVVQGDPWILPTAITGQQVVANGQVVQLGDEDLRPGFDPLQYIAMTPPQLAQVQPPLTKAERAKIYQAREKKRIEDAQSHAKSSPRTSTPRPGNGGGRPGNEAPAPEDSARPAAARSVNGAPPPPGGSPDLPPEEGGAGNNGGPQTPQQQNYAQMFPLPAQADFDPRTLTSTQGQPTILVGWAHDASAQPGKTYRYAVKYSIKNPVWATINITEPKTLATTFALESDKSDWTQPVAVPPVVRFYFTSASPGVSMPVEVYRWQNGVYHKTTMRVSPGDQVGKTQDGIDYGTNFTVVDFRSDSMHDNTYVWMLNPDGALVRRDCKADSNSADLIQMRHFYDQQQQQLQQQNGQPPGGQANAAGGVTPALINQTR